MRKWEERDVRWKMMMMMTAKERTQRRRAFEKWGNVMRN